MKARLTFELNDPDDKVAHMHALYGADYALVIKDIFEWLRRCEKGDVPITPAEVVKEINECLEMYDISPDTLYL